MVRNLADIFTFLSPIVPTVDETTQTIKCYIEKETENETEQAMEQKKGSGARTGFRTNPTGTYPTY